LEEITGGGGERVEKRVAFFRLPQKTEFAGKTRYPGRTSQIRTVPTGKVKGEKIVVVGKGRRGGHSIARPKIKSEKKKETSKLSTELDAGVSRKSNGIQTGRKKKDHHVPSGEGGEVPESVRQQQRQYAMRTKELGGAEAT